MYHPQTPTRRGHFWVVGVAAVVACSLVIGCRNQTENASGLQSRIQQNLDKLTSDDRRLAEQQKYCAVETDNELGSMGVPVKVVLKGQAVFLCCKGCRETAEAEPDKTLARAKKLRETNAGNSKRGGHSGS